MGSNVSSGTANRIAWYSAATTISSGSITTDGAYLGSVSYLSINTPHQTSYRAYINGNSYLSDISLIANSTIIIPSVSYTTLISSYGLRSDYTSSGYPTEDFLKAWCKWVYAQNNVPDHTVHSYISPNSRGYIVADVYASGINSTTGLPEHITGRYYPHSGSEIIFGTSYGTWYYRNAYDDSYHPNADYIYVEATGTGDWMYPNFTYYGNTYRREYVYTKLRFQPSTGHLLINGSFDNCPTKYDDGNDRPGISITGSYPQLSLISNVSNSSHGPVFSIGAYDSAGANSGGFKTFRLGTKGYDATWLDLSYGTHSNVHEGIDGWNPSGNGLQITRFHNNRTIYNYGTVYFGVASYGASYYHSGYTVYSYDKISYYSYTYNRAVIGGSTISDYTLDVYGTTRSTNRIYANEWIQFDNWTGLYSPNNGAHFYPNNTTSFGQWQLRGSRNGYSGIHFGDSTHYMTLMDNYTDKGIYQQDQRWILYYNANNGKVSLRDSADFGADINLNGSVRTNSTYYGYGLYHLSYGSSEYFLTSDGGAKHWSWLDNYYLRLFRRINSNGSSNNSGTIPSSILEFKNGYPLHPDSEFAHGYNDMSTYDNNGSGNTYLTRETSSTCGNSTGYVIKVTSGSGASPGYGGWYFADGTRANTDMTCIFRALIPSGVSVEWASNSIGSGGTGYWLTEHIGTGKWEWYAFHVKGGTSSLSSTNFYYVTTACTWYISFANTYINTYGTWDGNARYVIGDNRSSSPVGALLQSGWGRPDNSPDGDTWIFLDTLGGTSSYWGIRHNQANNSIGFCGQGSECCRIPLYSGISGYIGSSLAVGAATTPSYTLDVRGNGRITARLYCNEWIEFNQASGLYFPNYYGGHFFPNIYTTYGQFVILGSKNSYSGIQFGSSTGYMTVMDSGGAKGLYQENTGWGLLWYPGSNLVYLANNVFYVNSSGAYHTSDITLKYDILDILNKDVIDLFNTENGYIRHFKWKKDNKDSYGFIAQEIQEYCPQAVDINKENNLLHVNYNVAYGKIIGAMFKKIKMQDELINQLRQEISKLNEKINGSS